MANRRYIDFPIASTSGDTDIILIWQDGANKQTTKATFLSGLPENLEDLNDVVISGLTNGQILRYDSVTGKWENTDQGNLDLNDLNDVSIVSPSNGQVLVYNSSTSKWENSSGGFVPYTGAVTTVNLGAQTIQAGSFVKAGGTSSQFLKADGSIDSTAYGTGSVTSVGLTMPSAFNVANSPITTAGTLAVTGAGTVGQYIRGDGSLADFPQASGGGSSVSYYLNGSVNQGTIGGVAYKELSKVPILGAGTQFSINANGYIAQFLTDAGDPNLLEIPGGNWNFETYFSASSGGGSPTFYVELYKYDGTTFTLIASSSTSPEFIAFGTNLTPYYSTLAVPTTTLALTDRLAVRYYVTHSGRTITMHTENNTLCQIVTTFTTGLTSLNGLTAQVQNLAVGTSGTDFNIASATATHTFNLPTASATNRGALSSADWSLFRQAYNDKINSASVTGTTTKTLTLVQQDGGEIQASWSDLNTDAVTSVFGRTGAVVAVSGDYNTSQVTESGNLYFTQARVSANTDVAANTAARHNAVTLGTANGLSLSTQQLSLGLASGSTTGALSSTDWNTFNNKENAITSGTTAQYFRGDKTFQTLNTGVVPESGNLYFTNARAIASTLTGYVSGAGTISSADSILTAIQKLNGNIGGLVTGVSSVNGQTGAVTLTTTNIGEGTNLYFTNTRARAALSFAAGSGAYNTTTGVITIPTDNNQIANGANYITAAALSAYLPLAGGTMTGVITTPNGTFGIVIGDDSRLADRNVANTLFLEGNQNTDRGYINFSQTSGNALGAVNGGDLTWRGNIVLHAANFNSYAPTLGGTGATGTWSIAITGNAGTANTWTTARTITIGNTGKSVNGSANVAWSLAEIGAYAASNPSAFIALTALSGVAPIQYNNTTGAISITQASGSTNGFLSSTDWTTFNNKQNALTNPVTGTGTTNYLPKFTGSTTIGNSQIFDNGTNVGINNVIPSFKLDLVGDFGLNTSGIGRLGVLGANNSTDKYIVIRNSSGNFEVGSSSTEHYLLGGGSIPLRLYTNGTIKATLDSSGNLGLGVTPSAWLTASGRKAIEIGALGNAMFGNGASDFYMLSNAFTDGTFKYANNGPAAYYRHADAEHRWGIAGSGTAGNAISFTQAMTLTSGGNLLVGTPTNATGTPTFHIQNKNGLVANIAGFNFNSTSSGSNANNNFISSGNYYNGSAVIATASNATIYQQYEGEHSFYTNTGLTAGNSFSATERLRIFNDGNVSIQPGGPFTNNGARLQVSGTATVSGTVTSAGFIIGGDQLYRMNGYNSGYSYMTTNAGFSSTYNGVGIFSNATNANSLPAWVLDLGGLDGPSWDGVTDGLTISRKASGGSWANFFRISSTGAATFSSSVTAAGLYFTSNDTPQTVQGTITRHSVVGLVSRGVTSAVFDWSVYSAGGTALISNPTGTNNINFNSGNVGIGTPSPSAKLDVNGFILSKGSGNSARVEATDIQSGGANITINAAFDLAGTPAVQVQTNHPLLFVVNNTERMRIFSDGNVFIGSSPFNNGARLQVSGTATFGGTIYLPSSIAGRTSQIEFGNLSSGDLLGMPNQSSTFFLSYGTNNIHFRNDTFGEILRLSNNGAATFSSSVTASNGYLGGGASFTNIGQALNTPSNISANIGVLANTYAFIDLSTQHPDGSWIDFSKGNGSDYGGRIRYINSTDRLQFFTNGSSTASQTITSDGNVLIGLAGNNGGILRAKDLTNRYAIAFEKWNSSLTLGGFFQNSGSSGEMILVDTNGSQNVLISSSGNSYWNAPSARFSIGTSVNTTDLFRVAGNTFSNTIMTWNPENDNRSGVEWRLGAASIGSITPNRRLRVNVGGVEYFIGAVEV